MKSFHQLCQTLDIAFADKSRKKVHTHTHKFWRNSQQKTMKIVFSSNTVFSHNMVCIFEFKRCGVTSILMYIYLSQCIKRRQWYEQAKLKKKKRRSKNRDENDGKKRKQKRKNLIILQIETSKNEH